MIYILFGDDTKSSNVYIKEFTKDGDTFLFSNNNVDKDLIMSYSNNINLFNNSPSIIIENILNEEVVDFSPQELADLSASSTIFIFKEDKLSAVLQKKYKKYGEVKNFEGKKVISTPKFNIFSLTDSFANRDKMNTWILYNTAISSSIEPEAISGVLFWKIKMMILNGSKVFSLKELKIQSSSIVTLYHKAHRGEVDFTVSLEQFILSSLSSK